MAARIRRPAFEGGVSGPGTESIAELKTERNVLAAAVVPPGELGEKAGYDYGIGCGTTWRLRKAMGSDRYLPFLPIILNWIQQTLDAHAHERRAVSSFNFPRLPHYFSEGLLNTASVVATGQIGRAHV